MPMPETLDPAEHAAVILDSCHGDHREALELAHLNCDFSTNEPDRDYWDQVAIALHRLTSVGEFHEQMQAYAFVDDFGCPLRRAMAYPSECALANRILRSLGSGRRWMVVTDQPQSGSSCTGRRDEC